jgi:hypothetical protein
MTENLTVPTPSGPLQPSSNATPATFAPNASGDSNGEIQCVCGVISDDGYTICCDKCETWQHIACMDLSEDNLSSHYLCPTCSPRPIDTRRAKEVQEARIYNEKTNNRKKRTSTNQKKKDLQNSLQNGVSSSSEGGTSGGTSVTCVTAKTVQTTEKTAVPKLPSPKEPQPPPTRKRNNRASNAYQNTSNSNSHSTTSSGPGYNSDRNGGGGGDIESDTDLEKYKYEFNDIGNSHDKYLSESIKELVLAAALANSSNDLFRHCTAHSFSSMTFPKASVRAVPDSSTSYSEHPRWRYVLESTCPQEKPIALFKGEVGYQDSYRNEPINQYAFWNHPKPYVVFHPLLPVYIDARRYGSEARFVRRSCRPNLNVGTIVVDTNVHFALFSAESLKSGVELTLGWDWNGSVQSRRLAEEKFDFSRLTADEMRQAAVWVENLIEKMGECACFDANDCTLAKIRKFSGSDCTPPKLLVTSGNGGNTRKQKAKRNLSAETNLSKELTPDISVAVGATTLQDQDDDDYEAGKGNTIIIVKPWKVRETSPAQSHETDIESGIMTGRDARKLKDALSRMEKQEQSLTFTKRRKRCSTTSLPTDSARSISPSSEHHSLGDEETSINNKKLRKEESPAATVTASSPVYSGGDVSVADAGTRARSPDSSTSSNGHRKKTRRIASDSSTESTLSSHSFKPRRKARSTALNSNYVDTSTQTDSDDVLPWWKQPACTTPPRPPRLPLRKRLMQSLLRDRQELVGSVAGTLLAQDKKRKLDCFSQDSEMENSTPKAIKVEDSPSTMDQNSETSPVNSKGPLSPPTSSPGPMLGPEPGLVGTQVKVDQMASKKVNGTKPSGLRLHLPPATPTPPVGSAGTSQSPPSFSPSVIASIGSASIHAPSPTKTKKLSLQDYGKRKQHKAADAVSDKKDDEKSIPKSVVMVDNTNAQLAFLNVLAPSDQMSSPVDTKIIPERTANTWGVR